MKINGVEKLVPNLYNEKNYVIHIRALKQLLDYGFVFEKIYQAIEFSQSIWIKLYIDFNTQLRTPGYQQFWEGFL